MVRKGKMFGIALAVGAMIIAPFIANAGSLFDYLQEINGIYSIPILTIIVVGYLTKRVPAIAAKIGLLSGSLLYIVSQFFLKPHFVSQAVTEAKLDGITDPSALAVVESQGYFGLHYLDVMAILFVLNVLIMLLIGKFYPREEAYTQAYTKQVDIKPWPYTKAVGGLIVLIVAAIYIYFA